MAPPRRVSLWRIAVLKWSHMPNFRTSRQAKQLTGHPKLLESWTSKIRKKGSCWVWDRSTRKKQFRVGDSVKNPAWVAWVLFRGDLHEGESKSIWSNCGEPWCMNPKHLTDRNPAKRKNCSVCGVRLTRQNQRDYQSSKGKCIKCYLAKVREGYRRRAGWIGENR